MLDRLTDRLGQWATRRTVLILLALDILMNAAVLPLAGARIQALSGGIGPLDLKFNYSPDTAYAALTAYGAAGRQFYAAIDLTVDILYPIIYSLFFSLTIIFFLRRVPAAGPRWQRLGLLPFVALVADYLENACLVTLLLSYPARLDTLAQISSLFSSTKWSLAILTLIIIVISLGAALIQRLQQPDATQP